MIHCLSKCRFEASPSIICGAYIFVLIEKSNLFLVPNIYLKLYFTKPMYDNADTLLITI